MFRWLEDNKSWVFSGVGVALIGFVLSQFIGQTDTQNQNGTSNIQARGDVHITYLDPNNKYNKRLDNQEKNLSNLKEEINDIQISLNKLEDIYNQGKFNDSFGIQKNLQNLVKRQNQIEIEILEFNQERLEWASLVSQIFIKAPTIDPSVIQIQDKKIELQIVELSKEYENLDL